MGGLLGGISLRAPFLLAAGLNFLNFIYGLFVLPESLAKENRRKFSWRRANSFGAMKNLARSPIVLGLTATIVCGYLAQQILQSTWALHTEARFGWKPLDIGLSLVAVGIASGIVQGGLVRVVVKKLGERRSVLAGILFSVLGYIGLALANTGWLTIVIIFPFALGGLSEPAIKALLTREVAADEQGELQGSLGSLMSVTAIVGPLLGTGLFARFEPTGSSPHIPGAAFFAAAALNTIGLLLAARLFARMQAKGT